MWLMKVNEFSLSFSLVQYINLYIPEVYINLLEKISQYKYRQVEALWDSSNMVKTNQWNISWIQSEPKVPILPE